VTAAAGERPFPKPILACCLKWTFNGTDWVKDYTIQNGLNFGQPYTVPGYPTGDNTDAGGTNEPRAPATDGAAQHQRQRERERHGHDLRDDLDG
jgi:hypothetical protein